MSTSGPIHFPPPITPPIHPSPPQPHPHPHPFTDVDHCLSVGDEVVICFHKRGHLKLDPKHFFDMEFAEGDHNDNERLNGYKAASTGKAIFTFTYRDGGKEQTVRAHITVQEQPCNGVQNPDCK